MGFINDAAVEPAPVPASSSEHAAIATVPPPAPTELGQRAESEIALEPAVLLRIQELESELRLLRSTIELERAERTRERQQAEGNRRSGNQAIEKLLGQARRMESEFRKLEGRQQTLEEQFQSLRGNEEGRGRASASSAGAVVEPPPIRSESRSATRPSKPAASGSVQPAPKPGHTHLDDAANPDSMTAYMEQLLARSRGTTTPDGTSAVVPAVESRLRPAPSALTTARSEAAGDMSQAASAEDPPSAIPESLPEPLHKQDKGSVQADLHSLRHIANSVARSAIARHSSKKTRARLIVRGLLLTATFVVGGGLLTTEIWWGFGGYEQLGWLAIAAFAVLAIDLVVMSALALLRSTRHKRPASRTGKFSPASKAETSSPLNTGVADDSVS